MTSQVNQPKSKKGKKFFARQKQTRAAVKNCHPRYRRLKKSQGITSIPHNQQQMQSNFQQEHRKA